MHDHWKGEKRWSGASFCRVVPKPPPHNQTLVILHSFAVSVEQLCARSPGAPSVEELRPKVCVSCGRLARDAQGVLQLVGHGLYCRQVRGLAGTGWIVIWVRRFLCLVCGMTMSRLPDWLHPRRWYAATVIIEALYRHLIVSESACSIGVRFGRPEDAMGWQSLFRWGAQLLVSPTLWGWWGPRLGVVTAARNKEEGYWHLIRFLTEAGIVLGSTVETLSKLPSAVRASLRDRIHNGKQAWLLGHFPPGATSACFSRPNRHTLPTEKGSGPRPP